MADFNPVLARWRAGEGGNKGGSAAIERPEAVENLVWQTRAAPPTEFESALADALQRLFAREVCDLPSVVAGLNTSGLRTPEGGAWTEDGFRALMARLGA